MKHTTKRRTLKRGSILPVVLAMSIGVGALAAGYTTEVSREHNRERWERSRQKAYFDAWAQMETVASMIKASPYVASQNAAIQAAIARPDATFIDRDGWFTHVDVTEIGGAGSGFYELISTASVEDARARVAALIRERASFSDFVWFVNRHNLGVAGGAQTAWPYSDAPEGNIHCNQQIHFYFPDRHFRDPVTATLGFDYRGGATAANTNFHGAYNAAADEVTGLMDIVPADIGTRADTVLNLDGAWDFAKMKILGDRVAVEHWQEGHNEMQLVWRDFAVNRTEYFDVQDFQTVTRTGTYTENIWSSRNVWRNDPVSSWVQDAAGYYSTETQSVRVAPFQEWVVNTGSGGSGGGAIGGGADGYWRDVYNYANQSVQVWHPATGHWVTTDNWHWATEWYVSGTRDVTYTYTEQVPYTPARFHQDSRQVFDHWESRQVEEPVWIAEHKVADLDVSADGAIYVTGDVILSPITSGGWNSKQYHVVSNASLTIASGDDLDIRDSIQYGYVDGGGTYQTPFLNGMNNAQAYTKNPHYSGSAVLGLVANDDIRIKSDVPDQFEMNATVLASEGEFRVDNVSVSSSGAISTSGSAWTKASMRTLGGCISNQRPCTTYVDGTNTVTRGFRDAKTVYDVRQRTQPPRGFPTLNRPRLLAQLLREVN